MYYTYKLISSFPTFFSFFFLLLKSSAYLCFDALFVSDDKLESGEEKERKSLIKSLTNCYG